MMLPFLFTFTFTFFAVVALSLNAIRIDPNPYFVIMYLVGFALAFALGFLRIRRAN